MSTAFTIMSLTHLLALLLPLLPFLGSAPLYSPTPTDSGMSPNSLIVEIEVADSKLAQLESDCEAKSSRIRELQAKVEGFDTDIHRLEAILSSFLENETSSANEYLHVLEEEVQLLWETSRKNNFEIYELEFRVQDAESRLNTVNSQVEVMDEIVSHQWIQIQQLEQAVQMAKYFSLFMHSADLHISDKNGDAKKSTKLLKMFISKDANGKYIMESLNVNYVVLTNFTKFIKNSVVELVERIVEILEPYFCDGDSLVKSNVSEALRHLKSTFTAAKRFHHQLQAYIQHSLRRNEFTAILAHEEVVFVMASALITFPVLSFLKLLFWHFS